MMFKELVVLMFGCAIGAYVCFILLLSYYILLLSAKVFPSDIKIG